MTDFATDWTGSLHQTFRLLPEAAQSGNLRPFLSADGATPAAVLGGLPYDRARARARGAGGNTPDMKRYRDGRHVYQTAGLLYEEDDTLHVTQLGKAVLRWLPIITDKNCTILGRHAAYALSACQLRNPTGAGSKYAPEVCVFPFKFMWRAMIDLDYRVSSEELNRAVFKVLNEADLAAAVERIRLARESDDPSVMGPEVVTGRSKNDRVIPWVALASFGWTLFPDKSAGEDNYYVIPPRTRGLLREAARIERRHRDFGSVREYVEHVSGCAALPKDVR